MQTTPTNADGNFRVLSNVEIPDAKAKTYELVTKLFDDYALAEPERETETPEEHDEVRDFVEALVDTPPTIVARRFREQATNAAISTGRVHALLGGSAGILVAQQHGAHSRSDYIRRHHCVSNVFALSSITRAAGPSPRSHRKERAVSNQLSNDQRSVVEVQTVASHAAALANRMKLDCLSSLPCSVPQCEPSSRPNHSDATVKEVPPRPSPS